MEWKDCKTEELQSKMSKVSWRNLSWRTQKGFLYCSNLTALWNGRPKQAVQFTLSFVAPFQWFLSSSRNCLQWLCGNMGICVQLWEASLCRNLVSQVHGISGATRWPSWAMLATTLPSRQFFEKSCCKISHYSFTEHQKKQLGGM